MAKIQEENINIKLSKLIKNDDSPLMLYDSELLQKLEDVIQDLFGSDVVVEVSTVFKL
jgi:hypothetical protein